MSVNQKAPVKANYGDTMDALAAMISTQSVFKNRDIAIERQGTKIILPSDPREMSLDEGIETLARLKEQEAKKVGISEEVDAFPLEGAWALRKVLEAMFGYVLTGDPTFSIFGGEKPGATMVTLETGVDKTEQVLWGRFEVPGVTGELKTGIGEKDGRLIFAITGTVRQRDKETIRQIADKVRAFVKTNSLYKGQAIKVQTSEYRDRDGRITEGKYMVDFDSPPKFIDLAKVNESELVFSNDVRSLIQTNLFTPIEKTEECRKYKVPLKRAVLLEGPYGTGKTLTAYVTAKKAVQNGWTFIYMDRAQALRDVLIFARKYAPVAIFCEDIEQVTEGGRDVKVNDILNNIDGLDSKGHEVICIFTTNYVEKIDRAMLRAGRLDAVISVDPPNAEAAEKLVRVYARELLDETADLTAAAKELDGQIPAFIREVVERAKLFAIGRLANGEELKLTGEDFRLAAYGMKRHFALVNPPEAEKLTEGDKLALALNRVTNGSNYDSEDEAKFHRKQTTQTVSLQ